jgi:hypothetical protein
MLLVALVGYAAALVLPACAVRMPGTTWQPFFCPTPQALALSARQSELDAENTALLRQIAALQRGLAERECAMTPPPLPSATPAEDGFDPDAFQRRDTAILDGCWELDSDYSTINLRTGVTTYYSDWTICFEPGGGGTERMIGRRGSASITCDGPVTRGFDDDGVLRIVEPRNLVCSDRSYIYRREITCSLNAANRAVCTVVQPEVDRTGPVSLRRAEGRP